MKLLELQEWATKKVVEAGAPDILKIPTRFTDAPLPTGNGIDDISSPYEPLQGEYIYGSVGSGKTTRLYAAYLRYVASHPHSETYVRVYSWFDFTNDCERGAEYHFSSVQCLFIDDIGIGYETTKQLSMFYEIINKRWEKEKLMFFTSNLALKELVERYSEDPVRYALWHRIISRINDSCTMTKLEGKDNRIKSK